MDTISNSFQSVVTLGKLHSVFGYHPLYRNNRFILSGITLAGMLSCLCLTMFAFAEDAKNASASTTEISPMFTISVMVFFMLLGAFMIFLSIRQWWQIRKVAVAVFEHGLAYQDADGSIHLVPWHSIQEVKELKYRKNRVLFIDYLVRTKDGNSYLLHRTLKDIAQLGALVSQRAGMALQK